MVNSTEALKMALEVNESMKDVLKQVNELIAENKALKEALAQTQEPVATLFGSLPVYDTTTPQRTWVGLTDEEAKKIQTIMTYGNWSFQKIIQTIEAKLKEKNT